MKKILLIIIAIVILGFTGYLYLISTLKRDSGEELSERSKEFLQSQAQKGNLEFGGVYLQDKDERGENASQTIVVDNCFSFIVPFKLVINRSMGQCFNQILTVSPRVIINIYIREVSFNAIDEDPGILLRRENPEIYKEESVNINGRKFLIFKKTDGGFEESALYQNGNTQFSLNLISSMNDVSFESKFMKMLKSAIIL